MASAASVLVAAALLVVQTSGQMPCCFNSAQNATALGPVVVLRRDEDKPSNDVAADATWEATLRRAAARALSGLGPNAAQWDNLAAAPFVATAHSAESLAALDRPSDIRVLARGLLFQAEGGAGRQEHLEFRESELPGEPCRMCEDSLGSIKAMWSVRRIRHSGPNADRRPCYELQFSVTPVVPALPPLDRWTGPLPDWRSGQAGSRAGSQRDLRPKGLVLRVQAQATPHPLPDPPLFTGLPTATSRLAEEAPTAALPRAAGVQEHLHHHFYVRDGVPVYAGTTTEKEYPTAMQPFRPSPQHHQYSDPDPLYHQTPTVVPQSMPMTPFAPPKKVPLSKGKTPHPNSINEQLPPAGVGIDTRVPYVSSSKPTTRAPHLTTVRFPETRRPTTLVTVTPALTTMAYPGGGQQLYHITGGYSITTHNSLGQSSKLPAKLTQGKLDLKGTHPTHFETSRPTAVYQPPQVTAQPTKPTSTEALRLAHVLSTSGETANQKDRQTSTKRPETSSGLFLSALPAGTARGAAPISSTTNIPQQPPLFTPNYRGQNFEKSILHVMTSKVPSYIDIFTENGIRVTTVRPYPPDVAVTPKLTTYLNKEVQKQTSTKPLTSTTPFFTESTLPGSFYSDVNGTTQNLASPAPNTSELPKTSTKISAKLQTRQPHSTLAGLASHIRNKQTLKSESTTTSPKTTTPEPLITYFVAGEDLTKQPAALTREPFQQDDTTKFQYTILKSVKQSIEVMKHENDTIDNEYQINTTPMNRRMSHANKEGDGSFNTLGFGTLSSKPERQSDLSKNSPDIVNGHTNHKNEKNHNLSTEDQIFSQIRKSLLTTSSTTTRRPWRPSTRRTWRQRSNYKQQYARRKGENRTSTDAPIDPTSIVESRRTFSVSTLREKKPHRVGKTRIDTSKLRRQGDRTYYLAPDDEATADPGVARRLYSQGNPQRRTKPIRTYSENTQVQNIAATALNNARTLSLVQRGDLL